MAADWRQKLRSARLRNDTNKGLMRGAPFVGQVTSTSVEDFVSVQTPVGARDIPTLHPYRGPNSWIRVRPETRSNLLLMMRGDDMRPEASSYVSRTGRERASANEEGKNYFPDLLEGEWHMRTPGGADIHGVRSGDLLLRGGTARMDLRQTTQSIQSTASWHERNTSLVSEHEAYEGIERFGVVVRDGKPLKTPDSEGVQQYMHEYMRITSWKHSRRGTQTLVDLREGHVVEDDGSIATSPATGSRVVRRLRVIMDEEGTCAEMLFSADGTVEIVAQNIFLNANSRISLRAPNIDINERLVEPRKERI